MTFGEALRAARERAGWSQSRLAVEAGYVASYISRLEAGQREPSRETVAHLAVVLALNDHQAGLLLIAAGYLPARPGWQVVYGLSVGVQGATVIAMTGAVGR